MIVGSILSVCCFLLIAQNVEATPDMLSCARKLIVGNVIMGKKVALDQSNTALQLEFRNSANEVITDLVNYVPNELITLKVTLRSPLELVVDVTGATVQTSSLCSRSRATNEKTITLKMPPTGSVGITTAWGSKIQGVKIKKFTLTNGKCFLGFT